MKETRKLSTVLFADIAGYTSTMHDNEAKALQYLKIFKRLLENKVPQFGGQIIQYFGDACLLSFDSATSGVKCAISLQKDFVKDELPIRIGMHLGEVVFTDDNIFGDGVNIASRIESMGIPGSVLVSNSIRNEIKNKKEFSLKSLGSFEFKNVEEPMEVFALNNEGLSVPVKSKIQGKFKEPTNQNSYTTLAFGVLAALAILFVGMNYFSKSDSPKSDTVSAAVSKNSIAVLPLINLNKNVALDYFSDGVTQEIIDELAKIGSLTVAAFTTTYQYKSQEKKQAEIADELGVEYLISGSARIFDDDQKIKLSIELIDPSSNERIWNRTFEKQLDDVPSIQLDIAKQVAENLNIELTIAEEQSLERPHTSSGEAFRLFLNAKAEINTLSLVGFENGAKHLKEALKLDPNYAQAHTLLAWRYAVGASPDITPGVKSTSHFISIAEPLIEKALELDPEGSDIFLVRANLKLYSKNRINDAKKDVEKAIAINSWPRIPINYCICTAVSVYIALGDAAKAREIGELAKKIDPGHALYDWDLGNVEMMAGNFSRAQNYYQNSVNRADIPFFNSFLGWSYYHREQYDQALLILNQAFDDSPLPARLIVSGLANTHYKMGDISESDKYLQQLLDRHSVGEANLNLHIANVYLERNDVDTALDYLEKGVIDSDFGFAVFINIFPVFKKLKNNDRFKEIQSKIQFTAI